MLKLAGEEGVDKVLGGVEDEQVDFPGLVWLVTEAKMAA
jgi:hypothetical protein